MIYLYITLITLFIAVIISLTMLHKVKRKYFIYNRFLPEKFNEDPIEGVELDKYTTVMGVEFKTILSGQVEDIEKVYLFYKMGDLYECTGFILDDELIHFKEKKVFKLHQESVCKREDYKKVFGC